MVNFIWEDIIKSKEKETQIGSVLKENFLFAELSKKELRFIEKIVHVRKYRPGETIFRQGEIGVGMYIIIHGIVDIFQERQAPEAEDVERVLITTLHEGTFFGELSLVEDNGKRSATACAKEEAVLVGFFKPDLLEVLDRNPVMGVKITFRLAEILGQRLRATTEKVSQLRNHIQNNGEAGSSAGGK